METSNKEPEKQYKSSVTYLLYLFAHYIHLKIKKCFLIQRQENMGAED